MELGVQSALAAGRYVVCERIAAGGMAAVHLGRHFGPAGFARTVAIKRLFPALAGDGSATAMLLDEARLSARLHHPNIATTLDLVVERGEVFIIMEYVHGDSFSRLLNAHGGEHVSPAIVSAVVAGMLRGLHAAHEARDEHGNALDIIHRDVSPQNVIVGADGTPRLIDFGIAKARHRLQASTDGQLKGKLGYLAPEQIRGSAATRRTDVYAAGVVLWEALTGRRLFDAECAGAITEQILLGWVDNPSKYVPTLPEALDRVASQALESDPEQRYQNASEMADALERAMPPASVSEVADWVRAKAGATLARRTEMIREMEQREWSLRAKRRRRPVKSLAAVLLALTAGGAVLGAASLGAKPSAPDLPAAPDLLVGMQRARSLDLPVNVALSAPLATALHAIHEDPPRGEERRNPPSAKQRPRPHAESCTPPYALDERGIRVYKRACLHEG